MHSSSGLSFLPLLFDRIEGILGIPPSFEPSLAPVLDSSGGPRSPEFNSFAARSCGP
jgi:hypothetical protein